jgi:hypothetical protein
MERDHTRDLGASGRIILKCMSESCYGDVDYNKMAQVVPVEMLVMDFCKQRDV